MLTIVSQDFIRIFFQLHHREEKEEEEEELKYVWKLGWGKNFKQK